ncbi:MAG: ABC transporter permease [Bryobacteraceae bacterium]|jgi:ABC-type nitrate/sulfonate/bicarbonate transport system permease component
MKLVRFIGERFWLLALLLACWQVLAARRILDPLFFPPPSKVGETLWAMLATGELGREAGATLARAGAGLLVGVVGGGLVSILLSVSPWLRAAVQPLVSALYSTPRLTMLPMVMLVFGVNEASRVALVALSVGLVMVIQVSDAVRGVSRDYVDLAANYGASRAVIVRKVYLPACLPQIFTALRLSIGRALVMTISIEMLSSNDGIGSMIWMSWQTFATEKLYASVIVSALLGLLSGPVFHLIERRLVPWTRDQA